MKNAWTEKIERLETGKAELLEALKHLYDYTAKQFEANSEEKALWAQANKIASTAIAAAERGTL